MPKHADDCEAKRHRLSDWLALHELDRSRCLRILDSAAHEVGGLAPAHSRLPIGSRALDHETVWRTTADAMRAFFPAHRSIIDETFENTAKVLVTRSEWSQRAATLDNGPEAYPTIVYGRVGDLSDSMAIAHEFGHALQIIACRGKFVTPVVREICAFIGEVALLSYAKSRGVVHYPHLARIWDQDNRKYLEIDKEKLASALHQQDAAYSYVWNYPIARYLAIRISSQYSRSSAWRLFEGKLSVARILQELALE